MTRGKNIMMTMGSDFQYEALQGKEEHPSPR